MATSKTSEILFRIHLDENNVPEKIEWEASDGKQKSECKAAMLSLWDEKENNTLRIDLWNKHMMVDEMKKFFHQSLLTMADTFERATNETKAAGDMRDFAKKFGEEIGLFEGN